ncbi:MAG: acylphosphatase [Rhodospirillales bacterium]|nr:acylphosphatase [Rhodospirillales bacterium]
MTERARKTVRVRITGRVQGVWFRAWTAEQASELRLDGWVRNRRDGSVEAVFSGAAEAVDAMIGRCHAGPPAAVVDQVAVMPEPEAVAAGFHQRSTV